VPIVRGNLLSTVGLHVLLRAFDKVCGKWVIVRIPRCHDQMAEYDDAIIILLAEARSLA
jgi:hypothetical protein